MLKLFIKHYLNKLTFSNQLWWIFDKVFRRFFFRKKLLIFFAVAIQGLKLTSLLLALLVSLFFCQRQKKRDRGCGEGGGHVPRGRLCVRPDPRANLPPGFIERVREWEGWEIGLLLIAKHIHTHTLKLSFFNSLI